MTKWRNDYAILDPMPGYQRLAICRDGVLTDLFISDASDPSPLPGAIYLARVADSFASHGRVRLNLGQAGEASMRAAKTENWPSGKLILVTIQAEARDNKPPQARAGLIRENPYAIIQCLCHEPEGLFFSRRLKQALGDEMSEDLKRIAAALESTSASLKARITLRQSAHAVPPDQVLSSIKADLDEIDQILTTAKGKNSPAELSPSADLQQLCALTLPHLMPEQVMKIDRDGIDWTEAEIDQQIDAALAPTLPLEDGGMIHISTPPGAAVIDGDSGSSGLPPHQLADAMTRPLTSQLRLRRISGPVVIDFPRLDRGDADRVHQAMAEAVAEDPLSPRLYGWTKGGLYTLDRPYRWRRLDRLLGNTAKTAALNAIRLAWQQSGQGNGKGGGKGGGDGTPHDIAMSPSAMGWLNAEGQVMRDAITAALPLPPRWIIV